MWKNVPPLSTHLTPSSLIPPQFHEKAVPQNKRTPEGQFAKEANVGGGSSRALCTLPRSHSTWEI